MKFTKAIGIHAFLWLLIAILHAAQATPAQAQTFGCSPAMANDIVCENSKDGTPSSVWDPNGAGANDVTIEGFTTDISYSRGQTAVFKIQTDAASYHLDIYRLGYYGGNGARKIATVQPSASLPQSQPNCLTDATTKLSDCGNWAVSASWDIPADATSGIYFAQLIRDDTGGSSHVFFIVRNDSSHSDILLQTSDATWQAYNTYGGASFYGTGTWDLPNRAYKVSYNRPFRTRTVESYTFVFSAEYPMVRWLEANGYDVTYFTDMDSDRSGSLIQNHKVFISSGHDEYWSGGQRTNVEAARDAGVNLAFLAGNEVFWKTRWENSIDGSGTPYRTLVCYKETLANAAIDPQDPATWTGTWRDPRFSPPADGGKPENSLTGNLFKVNGPGTDNTGLAIQVPAADGKMRFWRSTSIATLAAGQTTTLPAGTLGYEWDVSVDNGIQPAGTFHMSTTTQSLTSDYLLDYGGVYGAGMGTHHLSMYRAPSGALVFGAGTVQWSWGLDSTHDNTLGFPTPPVSSDMQQATINVFADMGAQPGSIQGGLSAASKSTDTIPPVSTILSPLSGAALTDGIALTVTGTASDSGGGLVGGVEVSTDNGQTWHPASGRENWTYSFAPTVVGTVTLLSRAVDDSGNLEPPKSGVTATVVAATEETIFTTQVPAGGFNDGSGVDYELGTQFQSAVIGQVAAVRFWKNAQESGTHTGRIWSAAGDLLASVTFVNETASGWQRQALDAPLTIAAGTTYVVSVNTSSTYYVATNEELGTAVVNGDLSSVIGNNGVFGSPGAFPTNSYLHTNYYRDIVFVSSAESTLSTLSVSQSPVVGGTSLTGTVTLSGPAPAGGALVTLLSDNPAATVPASVSVAAGANSAGFSIGSNTVSAATSVVLTGIYNSMQTANLEIDPPSLASVALNPASLIGGLSSTGTVILNGPAPAGGAIVALSADNAAATVPASVTVPEGAVGATFAVTTSTVGTATLVTITGSYNGTQTAGLSVNPPPVPMLSSVSLDQTNVFGGNTATGTVTLSLPAPAGGAVVALSSDKPIVSGIEGVYSAASLPQAGSVDWTSFGPEYTEIPSGTVTPVSGISGVNMTVSTSNGQSMYNMLNCNFGGDCGWYGNFAQGAGVLWVSGTYISQTAWWAPNGPLTLQFDSPQRGFGFQMMGDELGQFTATLCAYNAADTLLGCVPFTGNGSATEYGTAAFMGLYDDAQEISKVTIDGGGHIYPHDFAISQMFVTNTRRPIVPVSVTVPAGAVAATFPVSTSAVTTTTIVNITAVYGATQTTPLTINPAVLSTVAMTPAEVLGGAASVGTVTLNGAAPAGGVVVSLSADNSVSTGVQSVTSSTNMPQDGSVTWTDIGPLFTLVNSGTTVPITGLSNSTVTISTANGQPGYVFINCPDPTDCAWSGNFLPAMPLLWVGGSYPDGTNWAGNGPMTLTLNTPQRGFGFTIMADESGPFTGTICAYNASNTLLGCVPFTGNGAPLAGGTNGMAVYTGIYDDTAEISSITIDAGGTLYPHDFAIGQLFVANARRMAPPSVKVQAGATSATFPVNTDAVNTQTTVTVTGNYQGAQSGTLIVDPAMLSSLSVSPSSVVGGDSATGTVTLGTPAAGGGAIVTLSSDNAAVTVPASVTVAAGATSATFTMSTGAVGAEVSATITGLYNGTKTTTLTIDPPPLVDPTLDPTSVIGGSPSTGSVTIGGPAPKGGASVILISDNPAAKVPPSVKVAAGTTTATFRVTTIPVSNMTVATITGIYNGISTGLLTIYPPTLATVALKPTVLTGGTSSTGTVTLDGAAPAGGASVSLSSSNPAATVPASVTVAAGAKKASFAVTTSGVNSATAVTITGSYNGLQTASLTINPSSLSSVTVKPTAVIGGTTSTGTVTLGGAAPVGGASVNLSSSNNSAASVPASVTVAAGASSANFTVTTSGVNSVTAVTITGTYNGSQTAALTINPSALSSISLKPTSLTGGLSSTGTVTLDALAATGGAIVALSSNNGAVKVPVSVTVPAGATTAAFTLTSSSVGSTTSVTITATRNAVNKTVTLTLNPPQVASLTLNPASIVGRKGSSTTTITLNAPAAGSAAQRQVTLASSNTAAATVPATVTVAAGATTATFTVTGKAVTASTTSKISATMNNGTQTATLTVTP